MEPANQHDRSAAAPAAGGSPGPSAGPAAAPAGDLSGFLGGLVQSARRRGRNYLKPRVWIMALVHLAVFALIYWTAFLLRFDFAIPPYNMKILWSTLPWVLAIKFSVFLIAGQYDGWWTYVTFSDLIALVRYSVAATFFFAAAQYFLGLGYYTPRYVIVMDCLGSITVLGACAAVGGCTASSSGRSSIPTTSAGPFWWGPTTPRACWPARCRAIANCPIASADCWPWKTAPSAPGWGRSRSWAGWKTFARSPRPAPPARCWSRRASWPVRACGT